MIRTLSEGTGDPDQLGIYLTVPVSSFQFALHYADLGAKPFSMAPRPVPSASYTLNTPSLSLFPAGRNIQVWSEKMYFTIIQLLKTGLRLSTGKQQK